VKLKIARHATMNAWKEDYVQQGKKMKTILVMLIIAVVYLLVSNRISDEYQAGYEEGMRVALKTNPPSQELEMTCAGLWVGEQNRKYFQKGLK